MSLSLLYCTPSRIIAVISSDNSKALTPKFVNATGITYHQNSSIHTVYLYDYIYTKDTYLFLDNSTEANKGQTRCPVV